MAVIERLEERVVLSATTTTLANTPAPSNFGQAVTLSATVTGTNPTGLVNFLDGTTSLGSGISLPSNGIAVFTTSTLAVGSHSLTAAYAGDGTNDPSTSPAVTQVVNADPTTTTLTSDTNPSSYGQTVTYTATVTPADAGAGIPTGTVTFLDGTTTLGTGTLDGTGKATFATTAPGLSVGTHSITASYAASTNFAASTSTAVTQTVSTSATTTAPTFAPASPTYGVPVVLTATVTAANSAAGTPTGTVTFLDGTTSIGSGTLDSTGTATFTTTAQQLSVSTHTITASYTATTNFATSTSSASSVVVGQASTTTTLASTDSSSQFGASETFTATVATSTSGAGTPSGTVTFLDGTTTLGTGTLGASGVATLSTTTLAVGSHSVTAQFAASTNFASSTSSALTHTVTQVPTTIHLSTSDGGLLVGETLTLTAKVTPAITETTQPSGKVTFLDGTTVVGTGTLSSGVATLKLSTLTAGHHSFTVSYNGDTNYQAATGANTALVSIGTANQLYVDAIYEDLLGRAPDAKGLSDWTNALDNGLSRTRMALQIEYSMEFVLKTLNGLTQTLLGSAPTQAQTNHALRLWAKHEAGPGNLEYMILGSKAYYKASGGTVSGFLTDLGTDVTGSAFTASQTAYLQASLTGGASQSSVALDALQSTPGLTYRVDQTYQTYLGRPADAVGQVFYIGQLRHKVKAVDVTAEILGSEEFYADNTSAPPATT